MPARVQSTGNIDGISGLKEIVVEESEQAAVEAIRSRTSVNVIDGTRGESVFRAIVSGGDLELLDFFIGQCAHIERARERLTNRIAVFCVIVRENRLAVG